MSIVFIPLLLYTMVILFSVNVRTTETLTDCTEQLKRFFVSNGFGPELNNRNYEVIEITQGIDQISNHTFVDVTINFQDIARKYQQDILDLNGNFTSNTTTVHNYSFVNPINLKSSFLSVDIPWCASDIIVECNQGDKIFGTIKQDCDSILDVDIGGSASVAGRLFIYPSQTLECQRGVKIRFMNTLILNNNEKNIYTYDMSNLKANIGINRSTNNFDNGYMSFDDALSNYTLDKCRYSNGDKSDLFNFGQNSFVCSKKKIGCSKERVNGIPSGSKIIPIVPEFICISGGTFKWKLENKNAKGVNRDFYITFGKDLSSNTLNTILNDEKNKKRSYGGTRRIFESHFSDFGHSVYIYVIDGPKPEWKSFYPVHQMSENMVISSIPCVCNFSIDCIPGTDTFNFDVNISFYLPRSNSSIPVSVIKTKSLKIIRGTHNFTLSSNQSYEMDNYVEDNEEDILSGDTTTVGIEYTYNPDSTVDFGNDGKLYRYWRLLSSTGTNFVISETQKYAEELTILSSNFTVGVYTFVFYLSNRQIITFSKFEIEIALPELVVKLPYSFTRYFKFYIGNCTEGDRIFLDGSASYSEDPLDNITYLWTQTEGIPLNYESLICSETGLSVLEQEEEMEENNDLNYMFSLLSNEPDFDEVYVNSNVIYTSGMLDTNKPISSFVPGRQGLYSFKLTIRTQDKSISAVITVIVFKYIEGMSNRPLLEIKNKTLPPIRNVKAPNREIQVLRPPPPTTIKTQPPSQNGNSNGLYDTMTFAENLDIGDDKMSRIYLLGSFEFVLIVFIIFILFIILIIFMIWFISVEYDATNYSYLDVSTYGNPITLPTDDDDDDDDNDDDDNNYSGGDDYDGSGDGGGGDGNNGSGNMEKKEEDNKKKD